jgi:hypothetical protein
MNHYSMYWPKSDPIYDLCPVEQRDGMIDLPTVHVPRTPTADDFNFIYDILNDEEESE